MVYCLKMCNFWGLFVGPVCKGLRFVFGFDFKDEAGGVKISIIRVLLLGGVSSFDVTDLQLLV